MNQFIKETTAALIDCRKSNNYDQGHIKNACSLPVAQLFARMHELPKRQQKLILYGDKAELKMSYDFLSKRGYQISEQIIWTDQLKQQLNQSGQLEFGSRSKQLWKAAPLIRHFVKNIMPKHQIKAENGLDIACGAGRDLVYLAKQGWQMLGVDRSMDSLQRVATLANYQKVTVKTQQMNLETDCNPFVDFADHHFALICVARYLHRPLFPAIKRLLKPNGILIYQTFMSGCEKTAIGRPRNPKFLLKTGELTSIFNDAEILLDKIDYLEDGRPVSAFIAQMQS